jgi:hypothetical protein
MMNPFFQNGRNGHFLFFYQRNTVNEREGEQKSKEPHSRAVGFFTSSIITFVSRMIFKLQPSWLLSNAQSPAYNPFVITIPWEHHFVDIYNDSSPGHLRRITIYCSRPHGQADLQLTVLGGES